MTIDLFRGIQLSKIELTRLDILFWCLLWIFDSYPLDRKLKDILEPIDSLGYCGGDPGWEIDGCEDDGSALYDNNGQRVFRCWADADISGTKPETMYYPVEEVHDYIRIALENIAAQSPELANDAREIITRYGLVDKGEPQWKN